MSLTFSDMFCGAGGSSIGAEMAGAELRLGLNHWRRAIETHAHNFPHADHDCEDVSSLTTAQIRRYPDSDILLASPECTNHSLAKGALRRKPQAASLFDDGPASDSEQDRSRATMWDVVRFAEQKLLKGAPYRAIVVENVPDAFKWGYNDDGGLFEAWRQAMKALGYEHEIVWLNSMFAPPTPQSRDRMYVVFWQKGVRKPNLEVRPPCWCPSCEKVVDGQQIWKKPGPTVWGRYGAQYLYGCPVCHQAALPGVAPAASAIDWSVEGELISDRQKPLAANTRERIRRGLQRLGSEPFAIRLLQGGVPRPLTLPLVTLTQRQDIAMVIPVAGNTYESTPGNRARAAHLQPMDTCHGTLDKAMVIPMERNTTPRTAREPLHTVKANGNHHGIVTTTSESYLMPYNRTGQMVRCEESPSMTLTQKDRAAILVPPTHQGEPPAARELSDGEIDACRFRMFTLPEISRVMAMDAHPNGGEYEVQGNKRERMAQYGNAVTPPVMKLLVGRLAEVL